MGKEKRRGEIEEKGNVKGPGEKWRRRGKIDREHAVERDGIEL
jgi:hypothetical protein